MEDEKTLYDKIVEETATYEEFEQFVNDIMGPLSLVRAMTPKGRFMQYREMRQERLKRERKKKWLFKRK